LQSSSEDGKCIQNINQKSSKTETICRWEDGIKMDFTEIGCEVVDWIHVDYGLL